MTVRIGYQKKICQCVSFFCFLKRDAEDDAIKLQIFFAWRAIIAAVLVLRQTWVSTYLYHETVIINSIFMINIGHSNKQLN